MILRDYWTKLRHQILTRYLAMSIPRENAQSCVYTLPIALPDSFSYRREKSHFMLVGSHARPSTLDSITISVDNKHLDDVQSFPYLGLVINKNLVGMPR